MYSQVELVAKILDVKNNELQVRISVDTTENLIYFTIGDVEYVADWKNNIEKLVHRLLDFWDTTKSDVSVNRPQTTSIDIVKRLAEIEANIEGINEILIESAKTDFSTGVTDLPTRLELIEGMISHFCERHYGFTSYDETEFKEAHLPLIDRR